MIAPDSGDAAKMQESRSDISLASHAKGYKRVRKVPFPDAKGVS
jgi:hypothetical protein